MEKPVGFMHSMNTADLNSFKKPVGVHGLVFSVPSTWTQFRHIWYTLSWHMLLVLWLLALFFEAYLELFFLFVDCKCTKNLAWVGE